ncbi:MAG: ABC transporter ATP-binding protein [Candidatus Bathyarchaeota archaeon]|nr:ABC transporter ATP-binding protein [Candidatus Bathyarchaeota archaeon]
MTASKEYAIETRNLTKTYKSKIKTAKNQRSLFSHKEKRIVAAVNHLDLQIRQGELFGLLGPNGAGKTTLVKVLCTLLPPDEGTALVNGFDVSKQQMQVKQSIGTLFSVGERGFFWRLNGYSNLEFYAAIYNVPRNGRKERIIEVMELVGLKEHAFDFFQKYSGGMKRKLALARTLLADPPILLLDEPTTGLDVTSSRAIRDFIKNDLIKKTGKTVLYTTHYIEEVAQMCNRVGIMNKGKIIALDTPDALKDMAKKGEVAELVVKNMSSAQVQALRGMAGVEEVAAQVQDAVLGQTRLRIRLTDVDALPRVLDFFFKEKIKLVNFKQEEPTLEDAFIELTGAGVGR